MTKFTFPKSFISDFIKNPDSFPSSIPEGAILRKAYMDGVSLRSVKGGWAEYDEDSKTWKVGKVCCGY